MRIRILLASLIMGLSGGSQAELHDRGGGMIYDDVLNITWLQDANLGGPMTWDDAVAWVADLDYGGFDDWRLPSMDVNVNGTIRDCRFTPELYCRDNELGYMFYHNLMGNFLDDLQGDQGLFMTIQFQYWSSTEDPSMGGVWSFRFFSGFQQIPSTDSIFGVWAVRHGGADLDGDQDGDGITNSTDNCLLVSNPDQRDTDDDGIGNVCDFDYNNDCNTNFLDLFEFSESFGSTTSDSNFNEDVDYDANGLINFLDFGVSPNNYANSFDSSPGPSANPCIAAP